MINFLITAALLNGLRNQQQASLKKRKDYSLDGKLASFYDGPEMVVCPNCGELQKNDSDELEVCVYCDRDFDER